MCHSSAKVTIDWRLSREAMVEKTMSQFDMIIKGGTLVSPETQGSADIGIRAGRFAEIGDLTTAHADEVIDATGLHVLPGVIDTQVHFREPGLEHKEDLETGSRAAVLGGIVGVFEMPNTKPATTTPDAMADKLSRAHHRMHCDFAFYAGGAHDNVALIPELERMTGVVGIKVFMGSSTGSLLVPDDPGVEAILRAITRRAAFHCEDEYRLRERREYAETGKVETHPVWRDAESAFNCTRRLLQIARSVGKSIHVLHVTTEEEMQLLAANRDIASVEVTPQHLTLHAPDCYERLGTFAQMNPPIREAHHRAGLWKALQAGIVDVIGSDHAPHTREEKEKTYPNSPAGMPGVQTLLPLMLNHVHHNRLKLTDLVRLTSANPARLFKLVDRGHVAVGQHADLTLVDLKRQVTISEKWLASRCGWSPFTGDQVTGWPIATIIRGTCVMRDDEIVNPSRGEAFHFDTGRS
jgi:dihydroorotase